MSTRRHFNKYNSIETDVNDIELKDYPSRHLSSKLKLIYDQWTMDKGDELLILGYFRECNITWQPLSFDVNRIIASYYTKHQTKGFLKRKIIEIQKERKFRRKQQIRTSGQYIAFLLIFMVILAVAIGTDIAALRIVEKVDCDSGLHLPDSISFGINDFLFFGSIVHITIVGFLLCFVAVYLFCSNEYYPCERETLPYIIIVCCFFVGLFFISWSAVGAVLHQNMYHQSHIKQCSDVLISWITFKFVTYSLPILAMIYYVISECCTQETAIISYSCFFIVVVGLSFGVDIAGLVIASVRDCNLTVQHTDEPFVFGVNEFLLIGCSVHLGIGLVSSLLVCSSCIVGDRCAYSWAEYAMCMGAGLIVIFGLFLLAWSIVGCVLYAEMDTSTHANKQCADVTITWIVVKFIECISLKPGLVFLLLFCLFYDES